VLPTEPKVIATQFHKWLLSIREAIKKIDAGLQLGAYPEQIPGKFTSERASLMIDISNRAMGEWDDDLPNFTLLVRFTRLRHTAFPQTYLLLCPWYA